MSYAESLCLARVRARMPRVTALFAVLMLLQVSQTLAGAQTASQRQAYEELQRKYEAAQQDIIRLRTELETLKRERALAPPQEAGAASGPGEEALQTGNTHFMAQRYAEAIAAYTRVIEQTPREARAYKHRGMAQAKLGNMQQGLKDLTRAIELDPQDAVAYNQRGIAVFALGNTAAALKDFTRAIELQPQLLEAYNNRGIVQRKLGDYRLASKDFEYAAQAGMELANQHLKVLRDEVSQTQDRLRAAGFKPGTTDGVLKKPTVAALQQYQKAHGIPATGLLDEATRKALGLPAEPALAARPAGEGARFTHQPPPAYPEVARQNGWEGTVALRLELRPDGTVGEVQVAQSSGHAALDNAAQDAAKTWKHVPATQDGSAVARWVETQLTFTLDKGP